MQLKNSYLCIINNNNVGTKEKLIERFKSQPSDFKWNELVRLFAAFGYEMGNKGKTSGSRIIFRKGDSTYTAHKPHPDSTIKMYVMKQVMEFLKSNKLV